MTIYQKIITSLCTITAIFLLAWILHRLTLKKWKSSWGEILSRPLSKALILISMLLSAILTVHIWNLPENRLAFANNILFSLTVIAFTIIFTSIASAIIEIYKQRGDHAIAAATLTKNITNSVIFIIGCLILLNHFNISIAPLLTAMGIGGLAIALGLQDTLSNIFAGIYIIWAGRMKIGDYIKLSTGEEGCVHDIAWRETRIRMSLNKILTIPNSLISKVAIINFSRPSEDVGFILSFGVDYTSDLDHVEKVTLEVARKVLSTVPGALPTFEPILRFKTFGDSSIDLNLILRVKSYEAQNLVNHELLKELHKKFKQENINLPYPTRRIFQEKSEEVY